MDEVGISTANNQAFQRKRDVRLTLRGMATTFSSVEAAGFAANPRQWLPSALNTSKEGTMRLLKPIRRHI
jgi:hypothetical protein